jgi:hypothetical protein
MVRSIDRSESSGLSEILSPVRPLDTWQQVGNIRSVAESRRMREQKVVGVCQTVR